MNANERTSWLSHLDTWLLVVVVAVAALAVLQVISWIVGTVLFLAKAAVIVAAVVVLGRLALRRL